MKRWTYLLSVILAIGFSGCAHIRTSSSSSGLVLLSISRSEIARLGNRVGMTNAFSWGPGRDAKGERLLLTLWTTFGHDNLVTVDVGGVHTLPWSAWRSSYIPADEHINLQDPPTSASGRVSIEGVSTNAEIETQSGDWAVFRAHDRPPWLAKIETPTVPLLELPESASVISIWSDGPIVHLFTRRGWQYEDGPLQYQVYDFASGSPKLLKKLDLPRARRAEDMDPKAGLVVLQSNNRAMARSSLLDLKTGRTKFLRVWPSMVDFVFVKKETAEQWIKLTRP